MKTFMSPDDPVASVKLSPGFLRYFLCMPPREAWSLFGDVPYKIDLQLPGDSARVLYESGRSELVTREPA